MRRTYITTRATLLLAMLLALLVLLSLLSLPSFAQSVGSFQNWCQTGGVQALTSGLPSTNTLQGSYPGCQVSVFLTGTSTLATIYSDRNLASLGNPFTASTIDGSFIFYAANNQLYDVTISGGDPISLPQAFTFFFVSVSGTGGGGGGGGGITGITTATGSGLTGGGNSGVLNLSLYTGCSPNQTQIWNGTAWICGFPAVWSSLQPPAANLTLPLFSGSTAYTSTLIGGDFGASPVPGVVAFTDSSVTSSDNSANLYAGTGNNSFHNPFVATLTTGGSTFVQFQVCNTGNGHVGITVVGNIITCPNLSNSPVSKMWVLGSAPSQATITLYQNATTSTGTLLRMNTATPAGAGFSFWTACAGATPNADGSCPAGNILASLLGNGTLSAVNYLGAINGVTISNQPSGSGQCPTSTSTIAATWQSCGGGGGGGGGTGAQWQTAYYSAANTLGAFGPGLSGQQAISTGHSSSPVYSSAGVGGSTVATPTYTVQCDDTVTNFTTIDRLTTIQLTNAAPTITVPDAGSTGCGNNFTFALVAATGTTATINRTSASTFTTVNGAAYLTGLTTFTLSAGQYATFTSPDNANYLVRIVASSGGGSPLWSSLQSPTGNLSLSMTGFTTTYSYTSPVQYAAAWINSTAALVGTPQSSPFLGLQGNYWCTGGGCGGGASAADIWSIQNVIGSGANGTSTFSIVHAGTSGIAAVSLPNLIATSSTAHFVPIAEGNSQFNYVTPSTGGLCFISNGVGVDPSFQTCPAGATSFPVTVSGGVSGGIPYFSSTTVESASGLLTANVLIKGGGAGLPPIPSSVTDNGTTVSLAEGMAFSGASGAATTISTTAANANLLLAPNGTGAVVFNNGTAANPSIVFSGGSTFGLYGVTGTSLGVGTGAANNTAMLVNSSGNIRTKSGAVIGWSSSSIDATTGADTGLSRLAADILAIGNGNANDTSGRIKAAAYMSVGTKFTSNAGCTEGTLLGGATAGSFVTGAAGPCTVVVTMGNTATAPNGWACEVTDLSNAAFVIRQTTPVSATQASFAASASMVSGDTISFACMGY